MDYNEVIRHLPIYKAILRDDWDSVKQKFEEDEAKLNAKITYYWETPLHIAVGTNSSHHFVEKLVEKIMSVDQSMLRTPSRWGNNALHYAAKVGKTRAAMLLVKHDPVFTVHICI